ncbi:hypothetical protein MLD38_005127 [Melastoma candidum]|uniref:Uncharacterized protein n=1 Tax=Melastoma candidum TaxID=119954 RepID=A0ACB9S805_9MYRT|nr:hypothetical protein MLD38_005127 [Melastoma candidum]
MSGRRPPAENAASKQPPLFIVAMKGHPGTGKSTLSRFLSSTLRLPLLDKDDVRNSTLPLQRAYPSSSPLLNDLSYSVLLRLASTQLSAGLGVIIDSPLSRRHLLGSIVALAEAHGAKVVVVECVARDEAEWRRRVEERGRGVERDEGIWHKPSTWRELKELVDGYGGCTEYAVDEGVAKLVVDTTEEGVGLSEMAERVMAFLAENG